jgi:hypothetical protein
MFPTNGDLRSRVSSDAQIDLSQVFESLSGRSFSPESVFRPESVERLETAHESVRAWRRHTDLAGRPRLAGHWNWRKNK